MQPDLSARQWIISGKVQGVGFRPFVYQLAHQYGLQGWVRNNVGQVEIIAQGTKQSLQQFNKDLINCSPVISEPHILLDKECETAQFSGFQILASETSSKADIHIPTDYFTCADCLAEMQDPADRRYQYPFINCTQCGPRYTLIESLPYDRPNTSMVEFPLCDDCRQEYENPLDRRFHAEPLACPVCGPQLFYKDQSQQVDDSSAALQACLYALRQGQIVAVKGVGGYHLMCDAGNDKVIQQLRARKSRPYKPLAVMFPVQGDDGLEAVRKEVILHVNETNLLISPARPIVLVPKRKQSSLSALVAPGLGEIGVMLAYSPLHHILLSELGRPLIATSANISGEPVLTDESVVEQRLSHITPYFLHHNRRIVRPADDSVYRSIAGKPRPIRLGRGHVPVEIELPFYVAQPILACGSHMKNTVALAWDNRLVVSPHIGDLDSPRSMQVFEKTIDDLQQLYQVQPALIACDAHPCYASTRWAARFAEQAGMPLVKVQHHRAHASALVLEHCDIEDQNESSWLVFSWDGTGYGDDGSIWGGEAFYGTPGNWQRVASMRPFHLPGGEKAGREPWRSAAALCWEAGLDWKDIPVESALLKQAWQRGINSPKTSAVGRLFDAASALTGLLHQASYEGQGPMLLEQASDKLFEAEGLPISRNNEGVLLADWSALLSELLDKNTSIEQRATRFHSGMAQTLLKQVEILQTAHSFTHIGLSGGVFQNRKLTDYVMQKLQKQGYNVCLAEKLPVNDAGISAGQVIEVGVTIN